MCCQMLKRGLVRKSVVCQRECTDCRSQVHLMEFSFLYMLQLSKILCMQASLDTVQSAEEAREVVWLAYKFMYAVFATVMELQNG